MSELEYNAMRKRECEELIPRLFHVYLPVKSFLFDDIETGEDSYAVLFESGHETYALLISSEEHPSTLSDVRSIAKSMGLRVQRYFPPGADPEYFHREGVKHFLKAYPARKQWTKEDIMFYESLATYHVALVRIDAIQGEVRRYNSHSKAWQRAFTYSYKKVTVA